LSDPKYITVTSGIKGYYIKVDQNPNNAISGASFITSNSFEYTAPNTGKYYIHIAAVDNMGNVSDVKTFSYSIPWLKATPVPAENAVQLSWGIDDDSQTYTYMVYKKDVNDREFQTIPVKNRLKVLNIYPPVGENITFTNWKGEIFTLPKAASLKKWMEEPNPEHPKGYGMGLIDVDAVPIPEFNNSPEKYMKNPDGTWKYDVIYFGAWDVNGGYDLSTSAENMVETFIQDGRGVLLGHDTIGHSVRLPYNATPFHPNFQKLSQYLNIQDIPSQYNGMAPPQLPDIYQTWGSTKVTISKKGLLTNYPWQIGDIGTILNVPYTHTNFEIANGDIWLRFANIEPFRGYDINGNLNYPNIGWTDSIISLWQQNPALNMNWYLTTWNNTAMIQTGHSNGAATPDEQKILANTLFYLGQVTTETSWLDHSAQDLTPPDPVKNIKVSQVQDKIVLIWGTPKDNGNTYQYYLQAIGNNDHIKRFSPIVEATITTGLKGYSYVIDQNPNTEPTGKVNTTSNSITTTITKEGWYYLHIKSVDNADNASQTTHYRFYVYPVVELKPGGDNGLYTDKGTYRAGEGIVLKMNASGPVYKITAVVWYNGNEFIQQKETELQKVSDNLWISRKYDKVLIIPRNMPDGTYNIVLNVYIRYSNGIEETKQINVPVTVKGTIFDDYKSTITK
jgi:hypothetical protein